MISADCTTQFTTSHECFLRCFKLIYDDNTRMKIPKSLATQGFIGFWGDMRKSIKIYILFNKKYKKMLDKHLPTWYTVKAIERTHISRSRAVGSSSGS